MKTDYKYIILLLILLFIIFYFYKYYNKEPMSSSIIGKDATGKDFDVTINNYPHIDLLRDKQVSYYRTVNNNQQQKFDVILQEEKNKFEKKKQELSNKVSELELNIENTIDAEKKKRLQLEKDFAKKELQTQLDFEKEKEQLIKNNKNEEEKLTNKLTAECNQKVKDKSIEFENKELKMKKEAREKLDSKLSDVNSWKKLAEDRRKEKENFEKECKANREKYIRDHNKKIDDMKTTLQNEYNTKVSQFKTHINILDGYWRTKYNNKPCNPITVTETKIITKCSLGEAQKVVDNHNRQNKKRRRRRRRRKKRRWSDLHFKYDIKQVGFSPSGIPIVTFKYNDLVPDLTSHVTYQGVLAQQLLPLGLFNEADEVVVLEDNGFYSVDYDMIDVEFKQV